MYKLIAAFIGLGVLIVQTVLSVNTIDMLTKNLSVVAGVSMMVLAVLFELVKPVLTIQMNKTKELSGKLSAGTLLIMLSLASIFCITLHHE